MITFVHLMIAIRLSSPSNLKQHLTKASTLMEAYKHGCFPPNPHTVRSWLLDVFRITLSPWSHDMDSPPPMKVNKSHNISFHLFLSLTQTGEEGWPFSPSTFFFRFMGWLEEPGMRVLEKKSFPDFLIKELMSTHKSEVFFWKFGFVCCFQYKLYCKIVFNFWNLKIFRKNEVKNDRKSAEICNNNFLVKR